METISSRVALGSQRRHHQSLRLPAGEQRRAVCTRQHAVADFDRAHGARVATVNARLAGQDLAADQSGLNIKQHALDLDRVKGKPFGFERRHHFRVGSAAGLGARLLVADLVGRTQLVVGKDAHLRDQYFVLGRRFPVPYRLAGVAHEFMDGGNRDVALLVAEHHRAEHDFFRQLLGLGLDHQHSGFGSGDDQVQARLLARCLAGVEHIGTVDIAHARCANRTAERNAADRQRGAGRDQGRDVGVDFRV